MDLVTARQPPPLGHPQDIAGMALSPDGKLLFTLDKEGLVKVWDLATGGVRAQRQAPCEFAGALRSTPLPEGVELRLACDRGEWLRMRTDGRDLGAPEPITPPEPLKQQFGKTREREWLPVAADVVSLTRASVLQRHALGTGQLQWEAALPRASLAQALAHPQGDWIAVPTKEPDAVLILDGRSGKQLARIPLAGGLRSLALGGDGNSLMVFQETPLEQVTVHDPRSGRETHRYKDVVPRFSRFQRAQPLPDGALVVAMDRRIGRHRPGQPLSFVSSNLHAAVAVALDPAGQRVALGAHDGTLWLLDLGSGQWRPIATGELGIGSVAFSDDGAQVLAGFTRRVGAWDARDGRPLGKSDTPRSVASLRSGQGPGGRGEIWATGRDGAAAWPIGGGTGPLADSPIGRLGAARADGRSSMVPAFSPDGTLAIWGESGRDLVVAEVATGRVVQVLADEGNAYAVAVSADNATLAVARRDTVHLFSLAEGAQLRNWKLAREWVRQTQLSRDGALLFVASEDTVDVYDTVTGAHLGVMRGLAENNVLTNASRIAVHPDGRRIAVLAADGTLQLWDWRTGRRLLRLAALAADQAVAIGEAGQLSAFNPASLAQAGFGTVRSSPQAIAAAGGGVQGSAQAASPEPAAPPAAAVPRLVLAGLPERAPSGRVHLQLSVEDARHLPARYDVRVNGKPQPSSGVCGAAAPPEAAGRRVLQLEPGRSEVVVEAFDAQGQPLARASQSVEVPLPAQLPARARLVLQSGLSGPFEPTWSPDGRLLLARDGSQVAVLNATDGRELRRIRAGARDMVLARNVASFLDAGRHFVGLGASAGSLAVWDALTGEASLVRQIGEDAKTTAASPGRDCVAVVTEFSTEVLLFDAGLLPAGKLEPSFPPEARDADKADSMAGFAGAAVWSADGKRLAVLHGHGWVVVWDVPSRRQASVGRVHAKDVESLQWDTDGTLLVLGEDGSLVRWDGGLRRPLARAASPFAGASHLAPGPQGRWYVGTPEGLVVLDRTLRVQARLPQARGLAAVSPDGRSVVAATAEGALARWALAPLAREWLSFPETPSVSALAVSGNGRHAVQTLVAYKNGQPLPVRYQVWDLEDGRPVSTVAMPRAHRLFWLQPALSPEAEWLAAGSDAGELLLWGAQGGELRRTERIEGRAVTAVAFDRAGARLYVALADPRAYERYQAADREAQGRLFEGGFDSDAFLQKTYRDLLRKHPSELRVWDLGAQRWAGAFPVDEVVSHLSVDADGRWAAAGLLGDVVLGDGAAARRIGQAAGLSSLRFSPTGARLLASGSEDVSVWDLSAPGTPRLRAGGGNRGTGAAWSARGDELWLADARGLRTVPAEPATPALRLGDGERVIDIATDGSALVASSAGLQVADPAGGRSGPIGVPGVLRAWLAPDARRLVVASRTGWHFFDGSGRRLGSAPTEIRRAPGPSQGRFSPDGSRFFILWAPGGHWLLEPRDSATGAALRAIALPSGTPRSFAVARSGRSVYIGYDDGSMAEHDLADGRERGRWQLSDRAVGALDVSPDGQLLLAAAGSSIHAWDPAGAKLLATYPSGHLVGGLDEDLLRFAPDGRSAALVHRNQHVELNDDQAAGVSFRGTRFHPLTGAVYQSVEGPRVRGRTAPFPVVVSQDGAMLGWIDPDAGLRRSAATELAGRSAFTAASLSDLHVLPNGLLLALDEQGAAGVWRLSDGERLAHWAVLGQDNWVVADAQGRFDAARLDDIPQAHWVLDREPDQALPIEMFMKDFYEPQLLAKILAGEKLAPVTDVRELDRTRALLRIADVRPAGAPGIVDVTVEVSGGGRPAVLRDLKLFLDGRLVGMAYGDKPLQVADQPRRHVFRAIQLPPSRAATEHAFTAYGFNAAGIKTANAVHSFRAPQPVPGVPPRAHVVAIGIDHYASPEWTLGYATADAHAVHGELKQLLAASRSFGDVQATALVSDPAALQKTSKAAILQQLAALAQGAGRVRPQDTVYLSWAGHGLRDAEGNFFLLTSEFAGTAQGEASWKRSAISMEELAAVLLPVQAAQWTIVIDACHSAATVTGGGFKPGPMGSRGLGQLAYDKRMRVLAASQESGVAIESRTLKSGLLTYALVQEGLQQGRADFLPRDKVVSVAEWLRYARTRVPALVQAGADATRGAVLVGRPRPTGPLQKPALFDFDQTDVAGAKPREVLKVLP
jgi:WD40 repeat protein